MIKYILLGFLNYQPMTGYDLKQAIDESSAHFWHAHHSQIYTTLRKMEEEGLVTSKFVREESTPDRRVYTLTAAGRRAFAAWLDEPFAEVSPIKEPLLVRLFFSAKRPAPEVLAELQLQRKLHQEKAAAYRTIAAHLSGMAPEQVGLARDQQFWRLTLELGMRYEAMYLAWLEHAMQTVQSL
jgi:PadR family transcriptional regulator AphA